MTDAMTRMDRMYRYQRHIYDASRKPYLLGRDRMIERLAAPPGSTILEIGCGTARNLVAAAKRYPGCRLYGVDASQEMLATACGNIGAAGLAGVIRLACGDAGQFDAARVFGIGTFDRVILSYALSMMDGWTSIAATAVRSASPGGSMHIVDFGDVGRLPFGSGRALTAWLRLFDVEPKANIEAAARRVAGGRPVAHEDLWGGYAAHVVIGPASGRSA